MSRSHRHEEEYEARKTIESNLRTMKDAIDDYEMTPDSVDFTDETAKLRETLLKLALKYHVLIDGKGSTEIRRAIKHQDPGFADELKTLAKKYKSNSAKLEALAELNTEITTELMSTLDAIGKYKLPENELAKLAAETMKRIDETTAKIKDEVTGKHTESNKPRKTHPRLERTHARRYDLGLGFLDKSLDKSKKIEDKDERKSSKENHSPSPRQSGGEEKK